MQNDRSIRRCERCGGNGRRSACAGEEIVYPGGIGNTSGSSDDKIRGIKQQGAKISIRCGCIYVSCKIQIVLARNLDESAITAICATARGDIAVEASCVIRPHDHLATITALHRICLDGHIWTEISTPGILNDRIISVTVAADEHASSASLAGRVYYGIFN